MYFGPLMSGQKHILVLSSWYPTKDAPFMGNFVQRQAKLIADIHQVTVLHVYPDEAIHSIEIEEKIEGNFREIIIYFPNGNNKFQRFINKRRAFRQGLEKINGITHIHGHVILNNGGLFVLAKKHFKCPLIITEHASYYRPKTLKKWSFRKKSIFRKTLNAADQLIAVSDVLKADMEKKVKNKFIKVIPNHIDHSLFKLGKTKANSFTFIHISTLAEIKNPKGIIDAYEIYQQNGGQGILEIISDGDYSNAASYASSKSLKNIEFFGPKSWSEVAEHLSQAHVFILNSSYETFSIVIAEAWSCGIPIISTPVGIAKDCADFLGLNFNVNDAKSLALKMKNIEESYSNFDHQRIHEYSLKYGAFKVQDQLLKCYE